MKKTKKHNTNPKEVPISDRRSSIEHQLYSDFFDAWPMSEERLMKLAEDLILMVKEDPKMISFAPWLEKHNITTGGIQKWRKKFPRFDSIYVQMKHRFTQRIVDKSLYRECDGNFARFILPKQSKSFKKLEEWRNNLKKEVAEKGDKKIIVVETPTFYESGKVPDKE